ncbi:MAG: MaoC family dehydratase N-terminal domain-containing protein [Halieaceae bacterium]
MSEEVDIDHLRSWIGKQDRESDSITPELLKRFRATLSGITEVVTELPLGIHWCLAQAAVNSDELGVDGHPAKGGFLPPVPLPRRMWASSRLRIHRQPGLAEPIERTSTIADVVLKQSANSGPLVFVQVDHEYVQDGESLIEDRQTIVYRQPAAFKQAVVQEKAQEPANAITVLPDSTLLFRYSAITFNGHRIHYDQPYTTSEEGYPGLVVHGPLMATLLMNLAQSSQPLTPLREFEFRGMAPAFVDQALQLLVNDAAGESLEIRNHEGALIMTASAGFGDTDQ